jgi:hypothetical protein
MPEKKEKPSTAKDIVDSLDILERARSMWKWACEDFMRINGDMGSCVSGASIDTYLGKKRIVLIPTYAICCAQGSLVWEESVYRVIAYIQNNTKLKVYYNTGSMD